MAAPPMPTPRMKPRRDTLGATFFCDAGVFFRRISNLPRTCPERPEIQMLIGMPILAGLLESIQQVGHFRTRKVRSECAT